ncbi:MAG: TetR/AcrR family transcriptional regulator [Solirubrobacteraceae bacterium]|jgi:AcrR family transcriptional regulator
MSSRAPTTEKGRRTRERIVQAAAELVAERGAAAVSLDDVGARAPASRSQLYHYFDDRADLIRAVVDATCDAVVGGQDELLADLDSWSGIERWMDALVALQVDRQACGGCPLGSLAGQLAERDPQVRAALARGLGRWEARICAGLERLQANGALVSDVDPAELAKATMALVQGGLLLTQLRRDPQQLRSALDAALSLLRAGAEPGHTTRALAPASTAAISED